MFHRFNKKLKNLITVSQLQYIDIAYYLKVDPITVSRWLNQSEVSKERRNKIVRAVMVLNKKRTTLIQKAKEALK